MDRFKCKSSYFLTKALIVFNSLSSGRLNTQHCASHPQHPPPNCNLQHITHNWRASNNPKIAHFLFSVSWNTPAEQVNGGRLARRGTAFETFKQFTYYIHWLEPTLLSGPWHIHFSEHCTLLFCCALQDQGEAFCTDFILNMIRK